MQQVIWTDEKIFVLNQRPNRKNDGTWSSENPHKVLEVNNRHGKKMMIIVAIVDGHIPIAHAVMGEDGKSQSVNGDHYQQLIEDVAGQLTAVPRLITRPLNFSRRNFLAELVQ